MQSRLVHEKVNGPSAANQRIDCNYLEKFKHTNSEDILFENKKGIVLHFYLALLYEVHYYLLMAHLFKSKSSTHGMLLCPTRVYHSAKSSKVILSRVPPIT